MLDVDENPADERVFEAAYEMVGMMFENTSPDLPEAGEKIEIVREYVGTSPDLPEAGEPMNMSGGEYRMDGSSFPNTSPDLH